MHRRVIAFLSLGLFLCLPTVALGHITVTAGNHQLLPNTPGQVIDILISTDAAEEISGLDLYVLINGADSSVDQAGVPRITAVDLTSAAVALGAVASTTFPYGDPWEVANGTSFGQNTAFGAAPNATSGPSADAPATGILAKYTIDTTGINAGLWPLSLTDPFIFAATLLSKVTGPLEAGVDYTLVDGSLEIVPEPSSIVLGLFAAAGLAAVVIRRRRAA
ncbi:MAG: PEP-CTERM sorting domain-containing protein [Pirellulales bacterium]